MKTLTTQALTATAKAQTLSGMWEKIYCAADRGHMNLENRADGLDVTVTINECGQKASVYRLPMSKQNTLVVPNTEDGISSGITKMRRRIKSKLRLVN